MLIGLGVVGGIAGLGAGGAAADVDALHLDGRRGAMIDQKSRALGSDRQLLASKLVEVLVVETSTTGDCAADRHGLLNDATFNSMLTVAVNPRPTLIPSRMTVPKPPSSYLIV